jgi:hypothetical protein
MNLDKIFDPNTKHYKILFGITCIVTTVIAGFLISRAGSLNPTSAPGDTMKTLEHLYCRLNGPECTTYANEEAITSAFGIDSPGSPTTGTMHTLQQIYDLTPNFKWYNQATYGPPATASEVASGKAFWTTGSQNPTTGTALCVQQSAPDSNVIRSGYSVCGVAGSFVAYTQIRACWPGKTSCTDFVNIAAGGTASTCCTDGTFSSICYVSCTNGTCNVKRQNVYSDATCSGTLISPYGYPTDVNFK